MKTLALALLTTGLALAADSAAGKAAYEKSCKRCHGMDGTPVAAIAKMMKVEMKHLGSKDVQAKSDAELAKEAKEGVGKMKPMTITDAEAANIVAFVRTLKQ
jgi:mono/diheme cytochrome c family protein